MENTIKEHFEKQCVEQEKAKFNIFSVLHKETDETRLHSRFITYLLDKNETHGFGNRFFKLFLEKVLKIDFDYNEYKIEKEYKYIDILIYNETSAIIIENKIYAGDSNNKSEVEEIFPKDYKGQLQRYYNTITRGEDCKGNSIDAKYKKDVKQVVYLTLDKHEPTPESRKDVPSDKLNYIDYTTHINDWLSACMQESADENPLLSQIINQYKELVTKLTSDINQAKDNQRLISENIDIAWSLQENFNFFTEKCASVFNHVKWHTVADFFNELAESLDEVGAVEVEKPEVEDITKVTHNRSISKIRLCIKFYLNGTELRIVNDAKGFTLQNLTVGKWDCFSGSIGKIKFSDFSDKNTFYIINLSKRKEIIKGMIEEVLKRYNSLKEEFKNS